MEKIKATARELLIARGASGLSLREVAREMDQTSSALYRYFPTRDDLLTALILDAYNDLGATAEAAAATVDTEDTAQRWRVTCHAIRRWALDRPAEYALIFGSPVPQYSAPQDTIAAASRVTLVLGTILSDHFASRPRTTSHDPRLEAALEWEALEPFLPGVPREIAVRGILAWSNVFGFLSFELFGHFVGSVRDADVVFDMLLDNLATMVELSDS